MYKLILVRHGESVWNKENRFTGWTDVDLSERGEQEARRAGELIKKHFEIDASGFAYCDPDWMTEALGNILKNCVEHCENGSIYVTASENPIYSEFRIRDTGCGIAEQDLPHIFERFYTGSAGMNCTETGSLKNNTHTENDTVQCGAQIPQLQSVGIGLALSRTIISKQNGTIKAENHRQGGAVFTIRLYKSAV